MGSPADVAFMCAASDRIGYGHLSRSLSLADALADNGMTCRFIVRSEECSSRESVDTRGYRATWVQSHHEGDAGLLELASEVNLRWIVVDDYEVSASRLKHLATIAPIAIVDDLGERDFSPASLIVIPTGGAESWDLRTGRASILAGAEFALVAPVFLERRSQRSLDPAWPVSRVGVALGGSDTEGWMSDVISGLARFVDAEIHIAGRTPIETPPPNTRHLGFLDPEGMADLMEWSDLFVATASTLTWELATLGIASAFVVTVENQRPIGDFLVQQGVPAAFRRRDVTAMLDPARWSVGALEEVSHRMKALTDGLGAYRVAQEMAK